MNKLNFSVLVVLTIVLGLSSCGVKPKNGRTDTRTSGYATFASDESFSPIIEEQREIFEHLYPQTSLTPIYTNERSAMDMLMDEDIQLAITSRRFTEREKEYFKNRKCTPMEFILAYDALALIVNNNNLDSCISKQDFKDVLLGNKTKWSDINPDSKLGDIEVVFDHQHSSTVQYCVDSLLEGTPINSPNIYAVDKSADVISYVERYPNAIGIVGSNWLNDKRDTTNVTFNRNVRVMFVSRIHPATLRSSWRPYQYYIYNGNYPFIRTIYALVADPRRALPYNFAMFINKDQRAQKIFHKSGLLPYHAGTNVRNIVVNGGESAND